MKNYYNMMDDDDVFQSFSDVIFCVCILLILFVVVLALNVSAKFDSLIAMNRFSGGYQRPVLYMDAYKAPLNKENRYFQFYGQRPLEQISLMSPSLAQAATTFDEKKGLISQIQGETFSGTEWFFISSVLELLSGIDPGEFSVDGRKSILLKRLSSGKSLHVSPEITDIPPSEDLVKKIMQLVWPVSKNPSFPVRAFEEYRNSRTRIFVEIIRSKQHPDLKVVSIGLHNYFIPQDIENGTMSFLTSLSSASSEIVYLGEVLVDADNKTNSRIEFFRDNGFTDAAGAFHRYFYDEDFFKDYLELILPGKQWNDLTEVEKNKWVSQFDGSQEKAIQNFNMFTKRSRNGAALNLALSMQLNAYQLEDMDAEFLPPPIRYPVAWKAYIDHKLKEPSQPPKWFIDEFLIPLGFDRRVVNIQQNTTKPSEPS